MNKLEINDERRVKSGRCAGELGFVKGFDESGLMEDPEIIFELLDGTRLLLAEHQLEKVDGIINITESALEYILSLPDSFFESATPSPITGLPLTNEQIRQISNEVNDKFPKMRLGEGMQPEKIDVRKYKIHKHIMKRDPSTPDKKSPLERLVKKDGLIATLAKKGKEEAVRRFAKSYIEEAAIMFYQEHMRDPINPNETTTGYLYIALAGGVVLSVSSNKIITIYTDDDFPKRDHIMFVKRRIEECKKKNEEKIQQGT